MNKQTKRIPIFEDTKYVMYIATTIEELIEIEEHYAAILVDSPRFQILGINKDEMLKRYQFAREYDLKHSTMFYIFDKTIENQFVFCGKFRKEAAPPLVYPTDFASQPVALYDEMTSVLIQRAKESYPKEFESPANMLRSLGGGVVMDGRSRGYGKLGLFAIMKYCKETMSDQYSNVIIAVAAPEVMHMYSKAGIPEVASLTYEEFFKAKGQPYNKELADSYFYNPGYPKMEAQIKLYLYPLTDQKYAKL